MSTTMVVQCVCQARSLCPIVRLPFLNEHGIGNGQAIGCYRVLPDWKWMRANRYQALQASSYRLQMTVLHIQKMRNRYRCYSDYELNEHR